MGHNGRFGKETQIWSRVSHASMIKFNANEMWIPELTSAKRCTFSHSADTEVGIFPSELKQELRCLLTDPNEYMREYLKFD